MIGGDAAHANQLSGSVTSVVDLGATRRLTVAIADGVTLNVITLGFGPCPQVGDRLALTIDAADVVPLAPKA